MKKIQSYFISGILIVAPLALSLYVAWVVVGLADRIFRPFIPLDKFGIPTEIPGVGLIVAFLFFTILGAIAGSFFGRLYHRIVDATLSKIPGLNSIYNTVKQIIDTFATTQSNAFKEVVLIEYPQKDIYALAFLTRETKGEIQIIGVGGVDSGQAAFEKIGAGANAVQLYTGMVYKGPGVVKDIKKELISILKKENLKNIGEAVGINA